MKKNINQRMKKEFNIRVILLSTALFQTYFAIGCMDINEVIKAQKKFTAPTDGKKIITFDPTTNDKSVTFYFRTNFDNTLNHMTIFSFKDKNDL